MSADIVADAELTAIALACEECETPAALLTRALPHLCRLADAARGLVLETRSGSFVATAQHEATDLDAAALAAHAHSGRAAVGCVVPRQWAETGVAAVVCQPLPGLWGHLVLAWPSGHGTPRAAYDAGMALLLRAAEAMDNAERLRDLQARVDNAQQLANMGDYDWHIASDTNQWSDQLYRIYGREPQTFNVSYEQFVSFIHPDDQAMVTEVHKRAYASGEPYQMIERILRPDGELRYLASNGQVLRDDVGAPVRFRGTCIDITDRVRAEEERERSRVLFQELVEASPDSIVVSGPDGRVGQANGRAAALLGGDPVGRTVREIFGESAAASTHGRVDGLGVPAVGLDGRELALDVRSALLEEHGNDHGSSGGASGGSGGAQGRGLVALFLRDARERLQGEALAAHLREAQVRRRQALEINDNVVQGLSAALYALEAGDALVASDLQRRTLVAARQMMSDLLDTLDGTELRPGDLVRSAPSTVPARDDRLSTGRSAGHVAFSVPVADESPSAADAGEAGDTEDTEDAGDAGDAGDTEEATSDGATAEDGPASARVLVVDDSEDVRFLLSVQLTGMAGVEVVGEAADGEDAVRMATELRPDLVLLDLAMPRMDGLQALPLIRAAVPGVRVVVLSGFEDSVMGARAVEAGACRYVEKGTALHRLGTVIDETLALA